MTKGQNCCGAVTTCFNDLGLSRLGFEHPTFRMRGEHCNRLPHRCSSSDALIVPNLIGCNLEIGSGEEEF